jgi:hypothetical protein
MTTIEKHRKYEHTIVGYENLLLTGDQLKVAIELRELGFEAMWWKETSGHVPYFGDTLIMISDNHETLYLYPSGVLKNHAGVYMHLDDLRKYLNVPEKKSEKENDLLKEIIVKLDKLLAIEEGKKNVNR